MPTLTRRRLLASAAAATALAPITGMNPARANPPCPPESLKQFLARADAQALTPGDRDSIVQQAIDMVEGIYAHLPIKCELYKVDPLTRLKDLQHELRQQPLQNDRRFHVQVSDIFDSLRDLHTFYMLPEPYATAHCWLPFKVEACFEGGAPKYIVSKIVDWFKDPNFVRGVEVLSWNGIPIEEAADLAGTRGCTGGARRALGLARLTYRALLRHPPPQEESALVRYRVDGKEHDIEIPWSVSTMPSECGDASTGCTEIGQLQRFREFLFTPYTSCEHFRVDTIPTPDGLFGYIRIFTFWPLNLSANRLVGMVKDHIANFAKTTKGLIIDVRDNGGGSTQAGERIIQLVAPNGPIKPGRLRFVATPMTLRFCQLPPAQPPKPSVSSLGPNGLETWIPSIQSALKNGSSFSESFEYTSEAQCNDIGRIFTGPVVVVTSALSYSAAELFAAGFQDHGGLILGVDESTGGGGAGARSHEELHNYFVDAGQPSPFKKLQRGGFSVAFRRSVRVGSGAGKEIEDIGVRCDRPYQMTRNDLLNQNEDLKIAAARLLAQMK